VKEKEKTNVETHLSGPAFAPQVLDTHKEAKEFLNVHMQECYRVVIYTPQPNKEKDYVQELIDEISKYTILRVGDFANVFYVSAEGTERSMQLASAAKYVYGELIHEFYHAPSYRMEFSIPRDEHLLANIYRAIYNVHPWGECMVEIHEISEFRRFGDDKFWDVKYKEVYRVDEYNKSGLKDQLEASAIEKNQIDPESLLVSTNEFGKMLYQSPTIVSQSWSSRFVPVRGSVDLGKKLSIEDMQADSGNKEDTKVNLGNTRGSTEDKPATDSSGKEFDAMKIIEEMKKMFEQKFNSMEKRVNDLEKEN